VRAYYVIRFLAQTHDITLVSFIREDDRKEAVEHLEQYCKKVTTVPIKRSLLKDINAFIRSIVTEYPAVILRDSSLEMQSLLKRLVSSVPFDVVHADQTSMADFGLFAKKQQTAFPAPKTILDQHNALHKVFERQAAFEGGLQKLVWRREGKLLKSYERSICLAYDHVLTVTEEDRNTLLNLFERPTRREMAKKMISVPICIDSHNAKVKQNLNPGVQLVHLGTMFWPPNVQAVVWFSREVLPKVAKMIPNVRFVVAGKDPPREVRALENLRQNGRKLIDVIGYILDATDLISKSHIFVVPLHAGGGMRVKILDAWAWGIPIITTAIGIEGIKHVPGENVLVAEQPNQFAAAIMQLINDRELAERLRRNGLDWVKRHYHWSKTYRAIGDIYDELFQS
jgi:glycosyltransferase involved in cell wall biosynthesis